MLASSAQRRSVPSCQKARSVRANRRRRAGKTRFEATLAEVKAQLPDAGTLLELLEPSDEL
jgi:hypothetical protein